MAKWCNLTGLWSSALVVAACGTTTGGGGGGGGSVSTGGAIGTICAAQSANEGCFGGSRMQCVAGKWALLATCGASEHCTESADPAAPGTTKHVTNCAASTVAADVSTGGDSDTTTSDSSGSDATVSDSAGGTDAGGTDAIGQTDTGPDITADVCTPQCAAKACGPNGCGGSCGLCNSNEVCDLSGNCVPDSGGTIAQGASCFGKTQPCAAGSTCAANADLSDWVCQKTRTAGQSCGPGIGDCGSGAVCGFTDYTLKAMKCYANVSLGGTCSVPGTGDCAPGGNCIYTDAQGTGTQCTAVIGPGGSCGVVSVGLCGAGYSCTPPTSGTGGQCLAEVPAGGLCGAGVGECALGSTCIYDSSSQASATCQSSGQVGDACGGYGQPGDCVPWAACTPDSSATGSTSHCRAFAASGGACGYNLGLCAAFLQCTYTDSSQTTLGCFKAGAAGDVCGAGVGGCLPGLACFPAAAGDTTGTCKDECTTSSLYSNGTCDTCLKVDPDCLK